MKKIILFTVIIIFIPFVIVSFFKIDKKEEKNKGFNKEFDPGSGLTLAARLTHASRTKFEELAPRA